MSGGGCLENRNGGIKDLNIILIHFGIGMAHGIGLV